MPSRNDESVLRVLVARLSPEKTVGLSFSHTLLARIASGRFPGRVLTDYLFFPERNRLQDFLKGGRTPLAKNSGSPASGFDVVAVSNSTALELFNLPHLLKMLSIPYRLSERLSDPHCPIVIMGGVNSPTTACVNGNIDKIGHVEEGGARSSSDRMYDVAPNKYFVDDGSSSLVDAIFMGEAEANFPDFLNFLLSSPDYRDRKLEVLKDMSSKIKGFYFPMNYLHKFTKTGSGFELNGIEFKETAGPCRSAIVENIDDLSDGPVIVADEDGGSACVPVEITRGCPSMCSFCKEGYTQKPYRERGERKIVKAACEAFEKTGIGIVNLYSYNFNDHTRIHSIVEGISKKGMIPRVKSQRIDRAALMPNLIDVLFRSGSLSPTFAVEGISPRMRAFLSKGIDESGLKKFIEGVFNSKPRQVKLFFIVTGLEDDSDISEFRALSGFVASVKKRLSPGAQIIFSFMPLVTAQKTPLMFAPASDPRRVFEIMKKIASASGASEKSTARFSIDLPAYEATQILERGGRDVSPALFKLSAGCGFAYYDNFGEDNILKFKKFLSESGFSFEYANREKSLSDVLPSDDRSYGITRKFLYESWLRAKEFRETARCRRDGSSVCARCGACAAEDSIYAQVDMYSSTPSEGRASSALHKQGSSIDNLSHLAAADKAFASSGAFLKDDSKKVHAVIDSVSSKDTVSDYVALSAKTGGAAFEICTDSLSRLGLDKSVFHARTFYHVAMAGSNAGKAAVLKNTVNLDFLRECNYMLARFAFRNKTVGSFGTDARQNCEKIFRSFNEKTAPETVVSKSLPAGFFITNSDGRKKHVSMPFISPAGVDGQYFALLKLTAENISRVVSAAVIEYVRYFDYSAKNAGSECPACARVNSVALPPGASSDPCLICRIMSGKIGFDVDEDVS